MPYHLRDNYGDPVPNDLVVLDLDPGALAKAELERVVDAPWYEVAGVLLVSFAAIDGLVETDPSDVDIDLATLREVDRIPDGLKRWSIEDGFYHA